MDPSDFTMNVIAWFEAPDALTREDILVVLAPPDASEIAHPDVKAMYKAARADGVLAACSDPVYVTDKVDKLCQALRESSLWDAIHNDITFPTSACHSPQQFDLVVDPKRRTSSGLSALPPTLGPEVLLKAPFWPEPPSHSERSRNCAAVPSPNLP
jgi:hypothetical protein